MKNEPIHSEMSAPAASRRAASSIYQYQPRRGLSIPCISVLDHEGRIVELAHMLGGASPGTAAMAGAREMLDRVEAWRTGAGVGA